MCSYHLFQHDCYQEVPNLQTATSTKMTITCSDLNKNEPDQSQKEDYSLHHQITSFLQRFQAVRTRPGNKKETENSIKTRT